MIKRTRAMYYVLCYVIAAMCHALCTIYCPFTCACARARVTLAPVACCRRRVPSRGGAAPGTLAARPAGAAGLPRGVCAIVLRRGVAEGRAPQRDRPTDRGVRIGVAERCRHFAPSRCEVGAAGRGAGPHGRGSGHPPLLRAVLHCSGNAAAVHGRGSRSENMTITQQIRLGCRIFDRCSEPLTLSLPAS